MSVITTGDPRTPGTVYLSGYTGQEHYVSAMRTDVASRSVWLEVIGLHDAVVRIHATAWNPRRDRIVSAPDELPTTRHACAECHGRGYRTDCLCIDHYGRDDVVARLCFAKVMPCPEHACYYAAR